MPASPGTPGPWIVDCDDPMLILASDGLCLIATVETDNLGNPWAGIADAKLIAAAPELAEALEALLSEETSSYCEYCYKHAPKDSGGNLTGSVAHRADCAAEAARAVLRKAGFLRDGAK